MRRFTVHVLSALMLTLIVAEAPARAQTKQTKKPARAQPQRDIGVRGFAIAGNMSLTAKNSFEAVLGKSTGPIYGGGGQVLLPWGIYVEIGASRFKRTGERVFIAPGDQVFKLGIPVDVTVTPLELTGGYRLTKLWRRLVPFGGLGYSRYQYKETSQFADASENVDEHYPGFHVTGGVEYLAFRWLAVGGEVSWSSIADAIGKSGVSAHFREDNLGGTSVRLKISVGR